MGQYPILEIKNATYADVEAAVKSVFGVASIDELSQKNFKESEQKDLISKLKLLEKYSTLKNAIVTGYTYKPLVGMTSKTEPSGKTTYYEYDDSNRLKLTHDHNGNIIESFEYNYINK